MTFGQIIFWAFIGLVSFLLLIFIYGGIQNRLLRKKQAKIFANIFGERNFPLPNLVMSSSYWWPTFEITFDSKSSFFNAQKQGLFEIFEHEICNIYGGDFDPSRAIAYK